MSSHNLPRKPVRFLPQNEALLKAQDAGQSHEATDYSQDVVIPTVGPKRSSYRMPLDRECGNYMFRRYMDGSLDLSYACHKVIDAIHQAKDSGGADVLNSLQKVALSVLFPNSFDFVDSAMVPQIASVQLRLSPEEVQLIRMKVAAHLAEEMNWNAGRGGGSVPGRSATRGS